MRVLCLQNLIHESRSYKAGEYVDMDEKYVDALQFMDLVYIEPDAAEKPEKVKSKVNTKPAAKTAPKKARKAASK